jgi:hypothetical protein
MALLHPELDKCHSYLAYYLADKSKCVPPPRTGMPFVTISRETGAGGHTLSKMLQGYLDMKWPLTQSDWTVFDKDLVQMAMKEHGMPERFADYLPEKRISEIKSLIGELAGLHPPLWELNQLVLESLLHLGNIGGVILIGRGSNIITRKLHNGLHLRLVGSLKQRVKRIVDLHKIPASEAKSFIKKEDRERRLWIKDNFNEAIDDPLGYDLTLNTDTLSMEDITSLVGCFFTKRRTAIV